MKFNYMHDWKKIFNVHYFHFILIKEINKEEYLKIYFQNKNEIEQTDSFSVLIQSNEYHLHENSYFTSLLKSFITNPSKHTLIVEEDLLKSMVKEDKRISFFNYLVKNNKNVVVFYHDDIDKYIMPKEHLILRLSQKDLIQSLHMADHFEDVKKTMKNLYNPFKSPLDTFLKSQDKK